MDNFQDKVIYQIYPKSFKDTTGSGTGDLPGIIEKLDYLEYLGVDMIWMNPIFISPGNDNGYDVANYYQIDPQFGTMADMEELIVQAKARNISIMFDMVFNHTSTSHEWFQKAVAGQREYQDYYFFFKGDQVPNNWQSKFGGSSWSYVPELDKSYLHLFDKSQADLNWSNPQVRQELIKILNFWLAKGVTGFRFDVINLISKDSFASDDQGIGKRFYTDGKMVGPYLREINHQSFGLHENIITVGEMSATTVANCIKYTRPANRQLTMAFNFHHLKTDYQDKEKWTLMDFDFLELKQLFNHWQIEMQKGQGWNALFYNCHDQPRSVSRFGDDQNYHYQSATMLATSIHLQRGTPFIYQGEEIGMTNNYFAKLEDYRDVETINHYGILKDKGLSDNQVMAILAAKSRDNARSPMQWDQSLNAGFSTATPWLKVNANHKKINVASQKDDPDSILNYYRKLIQLRKLHPVIAIGLYQSYLEDHDSIFAFKRTYENQVVTVYNNFYGTPVTITIEEPEATILLSNYHRSSLKTKMTMKPYESLVLLTTIDI